MPRNYRHRAITLQSGTAFHEAFFGLDDDGRVNFDQEAACAELAAQVRSPASSPSSSPVQSRRRLRKTYSSKAGRPVFPRFGGFWKRLLQAKPLPTSLQFWQPPGKIYRIKMGSASSPSNTLVTYQPACIHFHSKRQWVSAYRNRLAIVEHVLP